MKKENNKFTIDYLYKELEDSTKAVNNKNRTTIQKNLNIMESILHDCLALPDELFILRSGLSDNSNYLIRLEIKELVLIFLKHLSDDPFRRVNVSEKEVSKVSIKKLKESYTELNKDVDLASSFTKSILDCTYTVSSNIETVKQFEDFRNALFNFFMAVTESYPKTAGKFVVDMTRQLERWTMDIVRHSEEINAERESVDFIFILKAISNRA